MNLLPVGWADYVNCVAVFALPADQVFFAFVRFCEIVAFLGLCIVFPVPISLLPILVP